MWDYADLLCLYLCPVAEIDAEEVRGTWFGKERELNEEDCRRKAHVQAMEIEQQRLQCARRVV